MQGAWNSSGKDFSWPGYRKQPFSRSGKRRLASSSSQFSSSVSGFLGLLQDAQRIRNQEANVAKLKDSLAQLEAAFEAGRIGNRLQVDQARQALFGGRVVCLLPERVLKADWTVSSKDGIAH